MTESERKQLWDRVSIMVNDFYQLPPKDRTKQNLHTKVCNFVWFEREAAIKEALGPFIAILSNGWTEAAAINSRGQRHNGGNQYLIIIERFLRELKLLDNNGDIDEKELAKWA